MECCAAKKHKTFHSNFRLRSVQFSIFCETDCNPSLLGREIKIEVKYLVVITIIWAPETDLEDSQNLYVLNIWNASVKVYCLVANLFFN